MELSFWESKWRKGQTGFHMSEVYSPLVTYLPQFELPEKATILIPMCGKSLDIHWLANQGFHVIGIELSHIAVSQIMERSDDVFTQTTTADFSVYHAKKSQLEIWQGDIMKMQPGWISAADLVYDKAALIALPNKQRAPYARKIKSLMKEQGQIFQQTFEYPQDEMSGPPFSVLTKELEEYYGKHFNIQLLMQKSAEVLRQRFEKRGLQSFLIEKIYRLNPYLN